MAVPAAGQREGAAARALTSLSAWLAWVSRGAYQWLASAVLRLSTWGVGASASTAAQDNRKAPSGKKVNKKLSSNKAPRTKRSNNFPYDEREKRDDDDDGGLLRTQSRFRPSSAHQKRREVDTSEGRVQLLHVSFRKEAARCRKKHTICLICFIANFGKKSQVRPTEIKNGEMLPHCNTYHGGGSVKCSTEGCYVRAKNTGDIGCHELYGHVRTES